jgi:ATP-dependent RNA helicase DeaD
MMFSATISSDIDYLAKKHTKNAIQVSAESYVDPSKLKQVYYDVPTDKKFSLFVHLLKQTPGLSMVFCKTRRNADFVVNNLNKVGIKSQAIHGGLTQNARIRALEDFQNKKVNILVCTDIAARGLDIKGITYVYNYNLPHISSDYIHRIGRTARAGKEGKVINLLSSEDYMLFRKIKEDDSFEITQEQLPQFEYLIIRQDARRFSPRGNVRNNSSREFRSRDDRHSRNERHGRTRKLGRRR